MIVMLTLCGGVASDFALETELPPWRQEGVRAKRVD
jgi:hypothetical protein